MEAAAVEGLCGRNVLFSIDTYYVICSKSLPIQLCTLCLQWLPPVATYGGSVYPSAIGTNTPLPHVEVSPIATCAGGVFLPPTCMDTTLVLGQLALCGDGM